MKNDGLMHRNYLKGTQGDAINVILCGAGQNLRLILRHLRIYWLKIRQAFILSQLLSSPCTT
jgi:IS5 family transposase